MKVSELIAVLETMPPKFEVGIMYDGYGPDPLTLKNDFAGVVLAYGPGDLSLNLTQSGIVVYPEEANALPPGILSVPRHLMPPPVIPTKDVR